MKCDMCGRVNTLARKVGQVIVMCAACALTFGPLPSADHSDASHGTEPWFIPPAHGTHGQHVPEVPFDTTAQIVTAATVASTSSVSSPASWDAFYVQEPFRTSTG